MNRLIVTADDALYRRLACRTEEEGETPWPEGQAPEGEEVGTARARLSQQRLGLGEAFFLHQDGG